MVILSQWWDGITILMLYCTVSFIYTCELCPHVNNTTLIYYFKKKSFQIMFPHLQKLLYVWINSRKYIIIMCRHVDWLATTTTTTIYKRWNYHINQLMVIRWLASELYGLSERLQIQYYFIIYIMDNFWENK